MYIHVRKYMCAHVRIYHVCVCVSKHSMQSTANPTWVDIFECCFKAQSSKLERLFSLKRGKRDVRAFSFELLKMTPQVKCVNVLFRECTISHMYVLEGAHVLCGPLVLLCACMVVLCACMVVVCVVCMCVYGCGVCGMHLRVRAHA